MTLNSLKQILATFFFFFGVKNYRFNPPPLYSVKLFTFFLFFFEDFPKMILRRSLLKPGLLVTLNIMWGVVASIQLPFFPDEASSRGASPGQFDPVFGVIHLATLVTSPWAGSLVSRFSQ